MSKITFVTTQKMIDDHVKTLTQNELRIINKACDLVGVNINVLWGCSYKTDVSNVRKLLSLYFFQIKGYRDVAIGKILRTVPIHRTSIIVQVRCARGHYQKEQEFKHWYDELKGSKFESTWQEISASIKKSLNKLKYENKMITA